jgi:hypothetical protein
VRGISIDLGFAYLDLPGGDRAREGHAGRNCSRRLSKRGDLVRPRSAHKESTS